MYRLNCLSFTSSFRVIAKTNLPIFHCLQYNYELKTLFDRFEPCFRVQRNDRGRPKQLTSVARKSPGDLFTGPIAPEA